MLRPPTFPSVKELISSQSILPQAKIHMFMERLTPTWQGGFRTESTRKNLNSKRGVGPQLELEGTCKEGNPRVSKKSRKKLKDRLERA